MVLMVDMNKMHAENQHLAKALSQPQAMLASAHKLFLTAILTSIIVMLTIEVAYADTNTAMGNALCAIVDMVYGNLGRGLATLAIIVVGIGATLGKTSWGLALTVATGIAVIFNASSILTTLSVGAGGTCP